MKITEDPAQKIVVQAITDRLKEKWPNIMFEVLLPEGTLAGSKITFKWDELNENITEMDILKEIEGLTIPNGTQIACFYEDAKGYRIHFKP